MAVQNLHLRGSTYWWRKKVAVLGTYVPIALSLRTGNFNRACAIAMHLGSFVESLRMAYGERGVAIDAATLKKVFVDAMRWQLDRILSDQIGSGAPPEEHRFVNAAQGEHWRLLNRGVKWTAAEDERLRDVGWSIEARMAVADLWEQARHENQVGRGQIDAYINRFGIADTRSNVDRMKRVIYGARAEACDEASRRLGKDPSDFSRWTAEAIADSSPFAWEPEEAAKPPEAMRAPAPASAPERGDAPIATQYPAKAENIGVKHTGVRKKKSLLVAAEDCIVDYVRQNIWSPASVIQVHTAIRMFDFACGGKVAIEDITQEHVVAFKELCLALPNRWGRTKEEQAGGISESLRRATGLSKSMVGLSQKTIGKHVSWIASVLEHAEGDIPSKGHRPQETLSWNKTRKGLGQRKAKTRARDDRSAWTRKEIAHLLSGHIWHGCHSLDRRFRPGTAIIHDAWYWLPLMTVLYGGRSAECSGLPMSDIHEDEPIPYFQIDFTELRRLKNVQSVRKLPIHPELVRLGFLDYIKAMRSAGHALLFPEMFSEAGGSFSKTFYQSVFLKWRDWAFPNGTTWRHQVGGAFKDKDVHSFRGSAATFLKGRVHDSVLEDILGHEGSSQTTRIYTEETELELKLDALKLLTPMTAHLEPKPLKLRPADRQRFGAV